MSDLRTAHDRADRVHRVPAALPAGSGLVALLLCAAAPAPAAAQVSAAVAGHVGRSAAVPSGSTVNIAGEVARGALGIRVGAGMDAAGTPFAPMSSNESAAYDAWTADADVGLNLGRVPLLDRLLGGSNPTAFIGLGMAGMPVDQAVGADQIEIVPTWSYGARAGVPLLSWLSIEGEARHRAALDDESIEDYPLRDDWEYRVGLALRFGGAPRARATTIPAPRRGGTGSDRGTRTVGTRDERRGASAAEIADNAIDLGERYLGTPYVWGGESPSGFDCSGFVQYVFRHQGIELPRVSRDQAHAGRALAPSLDGAARGDLLFFASDGRTVSHVGIYAGNGRMLHSSSSGAGVRYDDLSGNRGRWYVEHLVAVRRVIDGGTLVWPAEYAGVDSSDDMPERSMPLDDAFRTLVGEAGDEDAPQ